MKTRRKFRDHKAPSMGKSVRALAKQGRAGDTEVAHLTPLMMADLKTPNAELTGRASEACEGPR